MLNYKQCSFSCLWQVGQNAEPAAQAASDQAIRPAGKAVKENAGPAAKSAADSTIRPAGQAVSDNAVPMTKSAMRDQVCAPALLARRHPSPAHRQMCACCCWECHVPVITPR